VVGRPGGVRAGSFFPPGRPSSTMTVRQGFTVENGADAAGSFAFAAERGFD
jgi:hypothetical protein